MLLRRKASAHNGFFATQLDNKVGAAKEVKAAISGPTETMKQKSSHHVKGVSSTITASTSSTMTNLATRVATATATPSNLAMRSNTTATTTCSLPTDPLTTVKTMQSQISESSVIMLTTNGNTHRRSQTRCNEFIPLKTLPLNRRASQSSRDSTPHHTSRTTLNTQSLQAPSIDTLYSISQIEPGRQSAALPKQTATSSTVNYASQIYIDGTMKQYQQQEDSSSSLAKWAQFVGRTTESEVRSEKKHFTDKVSPNRTTRVLYPEEQETPKFNLGLRTVTLPEQINPQKIEERSRERRVSIKFQRNTASFLAIKNKGILPDTTDREIPINKRGTVGDHYVMRDLVGQAPIKTEGDVAARVSEMTPVRHLFESSYNHEITALLGQYDPSKKSQVQFQRTTSANDHSLQGIVTADTAKYVFDASSLEKLKLQGGGSVATKESKSMKSSMILDTTAAISMQSSSASLAGNSSKTSVKPDAALKQAFINTYQINLQRPENSQQRQRRSSTATSLTNYNEQKKDFAADIRDLQSCLNRVEGKRESAATRVRVEFIDLASSNQGQKEEVAALRNRGYEGEYSITYPAPAGKEIYVSQVKCSSPSRAQRFSLEQRVERLVEHGHPNQASFNKRGRSKSSQRSRCPFTDIHSRGDPLWGEVRDGSVGQTCIIPHTGKATVIASRNQATGDSSFWFEDQRHENIWRDELKIKESQANSVLVERDRRRGSQCLPSGGQTPAIVTVCLSAISQSNGLGGGGGESSKPVSRQPSPARRDSLLSADPFKEQRNRMLVGQVQLI